MFKNLNVDDYDKLSIAELNYDNWKTGDVVDYFL